MGLPWTSRAAPGDAKAATTAAADEPYVRPTPSTALRAACIGVGGKGRGDVMDLANYAHLLAFAHVDFGPGSRAAQTVKLFPEVPRFTDYRVMFEKMGSQFDAVTISTPDHSHYPAAMLAMIHGKHVSVQKPMANTIWECRQPLLAAPIRWKLSTSPPEGLRPPPCRCRPHRPIRKSRVPLRSPSTSRTSNRSSSANCASSTPTPSPTPSRTKTSSSFTSTTTE